MEPEHSWCWRRYSGRCLRPTGAVDSYDLARDHAITGPGPARAPVLVSRYRQTDNENQLDRLATPPVDGCGRGREGHGPDRPLRLFGPRVAAVRSCEVALQQDLRVDSRGAFDRRGA